MNAAATPHRTVWTPPQQWWPEYADHPSETAAHAHALQVSRELGVEVAVVPLPGVEA